MPGYGVLDAQNGEGLLPWSWAVERLEKARNYWIATRWPDGQPHLMPVWGVWFKDAFYFSTGRHSRKARNLTNDPRCAVSTEHADEPVILEGAAHEVKDAVLLEEVTQVYSSKYGFVMEPTQDGVTDSEGNVGPLFVVYPRVVFGFGGDLVGSATRWVFKDG